MQQPPPLPPVMSVNPYAAPIARVEDIAGSQLEHADRVMRLVAVIVDGLIYVGVVMVIAIAAAIAVPMLKESGGGEDIAIMLTVGIGGVAMIALLIVNLVMLHRHGQTIGKRMFNIRILRSDGSHCSVLRVVFARWLPTALLGAIPLIGYVVTLVDPLMIFRSDYRCMHDLIADTIVVKV